MLKSRLSIASMVAAVAGMAGMSVVSQSALPYRRLHKPRIRREVAKRFGMTEEQRAHNAPIAAARDSKMQAKREARDSIAHRYGVSGKTARRLYLERGLT